MLLGQYLSTSCSHDNIAQGHALAILRLALNANRKDMPNSQTKATCQAKLIHKLSNHSSQNISPLKNHQKSSLQPTSPKLSRLELDISSFIFPKFRCISSQGSMSNRFLKQPMPQELHSSSQLSPYFGIPLKIHFSSSDARPIPT